MHYSNKILVIVIFFSFALNTYSQSTFIRNIPYIGISTATGSDEESEEIVFEARPKTSFKFYGDTSSILTENYRNEIYLVFDPHIRMFQRTSSPVAMPSYKVFFSYKGLIWERDRENWQFEINHGHYSNGQSGCVAGSSQDEDSTCASLSSEFFRSSDLSKFINRRYGQFSTNFLNIVVSRTAAITLFPDWGKTEFEESYTMLFSFTAFTKNIAGFNFGGYDSYAKEYYPMLQYHLELSYLKKLKNDNMVKAGIEAAYKYSKNPHVEPLFLSASVFYFFANAYDRILNTGLFVRWEYGQDSYNLRFVDKINRIMFGMAWDLSPDFEKRKP